MESNVIDLAMGKETQMKEFYEKLISQTTNVGVKKILTMIANEEEKHCRAIERIKNEIFAVEESNLLREARDLLAMVERRKEDLNITTSQTNIYRQLRNFERESEEFYAAEAKRASTPKLQSVWENLAKQERDHFLILDELVTYIDRPESWTESAEFSSLDMY